MQFGFIQELYPHTDKSSGEKFEDMFHVEIACKGTSLKVMYVIPQQYHCL